ncbi:unnamed protein product [Linum trigynum]|uniref:Reverse transcriptase domain-containing protein n=1 Tax=Linum trigynum TaxID=586398 RepID=A0AAV2EA06_9ROSI
MLGALTPYSGTYNEGWRRHPNFSRNGNNYSRPKPPGFTAPTKVLAEAAVPDPTGSIFAATIVPRKIGEPFQQQQRQFPQPAVALVQGDQMSERKNMVTAFVSTSIEKFARMDQFMKFSMRKFDALEACQRNQNAILKDLQNQIGGIARNNITRAPGTLHANTIPNPREPHQQLDAITTRSGKTTSVVPALARQEEPIPVPALPAEDEEVGIEKEAPAPKPQPVVKEHVP